MTSNIGPRPVFAPDGAPADVALARTTHMAIGAHQDDLEIMAADAIWTCFNAPHDWFGGVIVTDGAGSPRSGRYGHQTDDEMKTIRVGEQERAAVLGKYGSLVQMGHPSATVRDDATGAVRDGLAALLAAAVPKVVYTHNLADRHDTHVAVALRVIEALRMLEPVQRPESVYGCEVWRDLDWMLDEDKTALDVSEGDHIQSALLAVFDSQVGGGKRYDLAVMGRRRAHATFSASHATDTAQGLTLAMDLTPLMQDPDLDPASYAGAIVERFAADVRDRITRYRRT